MTKSQNRPKLPESCFLGKSSLCYVRLTGHLDGAGHISSSYFECTSVTDVDRPPRRTTLVAAELNI